jgi:histidinol-phosphate aminotransferase
MKAKESVQNVSVYSLMPFTRRDKIRLDLNESAWGCSPKVLQALRNIKSLDVSAYPDYCELIDKIAARYNLTPKNILLTNGADDAIRAVMQTYIESGDEVLLAEPSFGMIAIYAKVMGANVNPILYNPDFSFPAARFLSAIHPATRLIAIVRPDSPTGAVIARTDLIEILKKAPDSIVLLDETYHHFLQETCTDLIADFDNLIVTQSFSKAHGLAGLRLGFVASDERNIAEIGKVNPPFAVNSIAVIAGLAALDDPQHIERVVEEVQANKTSLMHELSKLGLSTRDSAANFILLNVGDEADAVHQKLLSRNILVKNLNGAPLTRGYFRIAIGDRRINKTLLQALQDILPLEAILFDLDGVLVDVSQSYRVAIKKTAEHFTGKEVSFAEIENYKRMGGYNNDWDLTEALIQANGKSVLREEIIRVFQEYYVGSNFNGLIKNERWLLPSRILEDLHKKFRLGIVTGRPRQEVRYVLKKFAVNRYFDVIIDMEEMRDKQKPNPFGIKLALEKIQAKRAMYIGDTVDDITAASSAGIVPIAVLPPQAKDERELIEILKQAGARKVLNDINELCEVLP